MTNRTQRWSEKTPFDLAMCVERVVSLIAGKVFKLNWLLRPDPLKEKRTR